MTKYVFKAETFKFNQSELYPEINDYFGGNTFVKAIASNEDMGHYWYTAIKYLGHDDRVEIFSGVFTKGNPMTEREYPRIVYLGLVSGDAFAKELLKNIMGTLKNESAQKEGKERLDMECLYLKKKK